LKSAAEEPLGVQDIASAQASNGDLTALAQLVAGGGMSM
jgi:hypothetical protein